MRNVTLLLLFCTLTLTASAQSSQPVMKIGGTVRGKYEYQTEDKKGRFEVRTARVNVYGLKTDCADVIVPAASIFIHIAAISNAT